METQPKENLRDAGVYLILEVATDDGKLYTATEVASKMEVMSFLEKVGADRLSDIKIYKGAKEVEIRTKVTFTF